VVLEEITFQFYLTKDSVFLTTDTETILNATEETLEQLLTHIADARVTDEIVEVIPSSGIKKAEYFLKNQKPPVR
jgi:thiaminase